MIHPTRDELPELVRHWHRECTPWLPAGLASRLAWGPPLQAPCERLSIDQLNRILEHNPGDFTITVEAGAPLLEVQRVLAGHGQWLAVDPPWGSAGGGGSLGGLVARGLAGGYRQRYLGLRDQLIGIGLVRADGTAARAGGRVVKNVAGYDLMRLLAGSWGSLALITELSLRTLPLPPHRAGLLVQGDATLLASLSTSLARSTLTPERIDWWSTPLSEAAGLEPAPALLIALASVEASCLEDQLGAVANLTELSSRRLPAEDLEALLKVGRGSPLTAEQPAWLLRVGVSPDGAPMVLEKGSALGLKMELGAGSGLGMAWTEEANAIEATGVAGLRSLCQELGGHLSVLLQPEGADLDAWSDAPAKGLMEAVKRQFDPLGQLAPGRLPGVARPAQAITTR
ncbi:MAG: FAD-binding oxidoreductase [Cyanobium sp.]